MPPYPPMLFHVGGGCSVADALKRERLHKPVEQNRRVTRSDGGTEPGRRFGVRVCQQVLGTCDRTNRVDQDESLFESLFGVDVTWNSGGLFALGPGCSGP